jgi:post-segregation antitoxin (ccd killing protein)
MADDATPPAIDPALLEEARAKGVDIEHLIDRTLRQAVAARRTPDDEARLAEAFERDNAQFIREYRDLVEREGVWNEQWRQW